MAVKQYALASDDELLMPLSLQCSLKVLLESSDKPLALSKLEKNDL